MESVEEAKRELGCTRTEEVKKILKTLSFKEHQQHIEGNTRWKPLVDCVQGFGNDVIINHGINDAGLWKQTFFFMGLEWGGEGG